MNAGSPILSVTDLSHRYGDRTVLQLDTLAVREGEILALVGPSGAGKSTLLRILNFLEAPSAGVVRYRGQAYTPETIPLEVRRRITTVFQQPLLLDATVRRNISYGLRVRGQRNGRAVIDEAIDQVGLTELAEARAGTLSGGEAQRVSLARALVLNPSVLLLDEPTSNLDPANVRLIEAIIKHANQERGASIVIVTHNVWQARRLAHRVGLLFEGELLELAETEAFFEHPQHVRTAAFLHGDLVY